MPENLEDCLEELNKLLKERDEARILAEVYRNLSCETQCEADDLPLPWDNART